MTFTNVTRELDNGLHPLNLSFNNGIEVFFLNVGEEQEVNGSSITGRGVLGDKFS